MAYLMLVLLGTAVVTIAAAAIRNGHKRPRYSEQRKSMATRIVRPYAIVEAFDANGKPLDPTVVYDAYQMEAAAEHYSALGCAVIVGTHCDTVH